MPQTLRLTLALALVVAATACSGASPARPERVDGSVGSAPSLGGGSTMDQRDAFTRSLKAYPVNPAAQDAFVAQAMAEARLSAATAVSLMRGDDADLAVNAEAFLRSIDELAIQPLLDAPVPADPSDASNYIDLLSQPELALRRKVLVKLDSMLEDRRDVPVRTPLGPKPEEAAKPRRVCDEAYIAMRAMIQFGEDLVDQFSDRDRFLSEPEDERDAAIRRARQSPTWQRALGRDPDDAN